MYTDIDNVITGGPEVIKIVVQGKSGIGNRPGVRGALQSRPDYIAQGKLLDMERGIVLYAGIIKDKRSFQVA